MKAAVFIAARAVTPPSPSAHSTELTLDRGTTFLNIFCREQSHAQVGLYSRDRRTKTPSRDVFALASFGSQRPPELRQQFTLCRRFRVPSLWLGACAFDLSEEEADHVERTFTTYGLTVERGEVRS